MADVPSFDNVLKHAQSGLDDSDVQIFFDYFEQLKRLCRRYLSRKAQVKQGASAVAQSALASLLCDLALTEIPLGDVDEQGYPMLWPLLLRYLRRHCDRWNEYYKAKKRSGTEVSLGAHCLDADSGREGSFELADYRESAAAEREFELAYEDLLRRLDEPLDHSIIEARLRGETLKQIADRVGRAESVVSYHLERIRRVLDDLVGDSDV